MTGNKSSVLWCGMKTGNILNIVFVLMLIAETTRSDSDYMCYVGNTVT